MKSNDVGLLAREIVQDAVTVGDVTVRGAMESVTANVVLFVEVVGNCVEVGVFGKSVVEGCVEDGDLGSFNAENFPCCKDALDVEWVVERSEVRTSFDAFEDFVGNDGGGSEGFSAVNDAMSDGVDIGSGFEFG